MSFKQKYSVLQNVPNPTQPTAIHAGCIISKVEESTRISGSRETREHLVDEKRPNEPAG